MIIKTKKAAKKVKCKNGTFVSNRYLLSDDNLGYSVTLTEIKKGGPYNWHYKNHLESCMVIEGSCIVEANGTETKLKRYDLYALDKNDKHSFTAIEDCKLVCVFRPALSGAEVHDEEGVYSTNNESPVYNVLRVPIDKVKANDYNPNAVAPPEMDLLEKSIWEDGYTQPVVTYYDNEEDMYIVVDGFHRYLTLQRSERINKREKGMLPIVVIKKDLGSRMASTIRHNRARGTHSIDLMSNIVAELVEMGKSDRWICQHIGMSKDELLRLKQITGVAALFKNEDFSEAWVAEGET